MHNLPTNYLIYAIVCILLSGCALAGGIGGRPEAVIYDLTASGSITKGSARISRQLIIAEPKTLDALSSTSIAVMHSDTNTLSFLPESQWIDELPSVIQTQILRSFENAGALGRVGVPGESLRSDLLFLTDVRSFNLVSQGASITATVSISAKVVDDSNGNVRAAKVFSAQVPAKSASHDDMVSALNAAFATVLRDMVSWTSRRF